jgi:hypothetical protein
MTKDDIERLIYYLRQLRKQILTSNARNPFQHMTAQCIGQIRIPLQDCRECRSQSFSTNAAKFAWKSIRQRQWRRCFAAMLCDLLAFKDWA